MRSVLILLLLCVPAASAELTIPRTQTLLIVPDAIKPKADAACLEVHPDATDCFVEWRDAAKVKRWVCAWRMTESQRVKYETIMADDVSKQEARVFRFVARLKDVKDVSKEFTGKARDKLEALSLTPK